MFVWKDRVDGVDDVSSDDINTVAHEVEKNSAALDGVEQALDNIISIQEKLIGGEGV